MHHESKIFEALKKKKWANLFFFIEVLGLGGKNSKVHLLPPLPHELSLFDTLFRILGAKKWNKY